MTSVTNPTYLLAPNWTFHPDGPIALGNIIGDPFRPHRWLSRPANDARAPETERLTEINWKSETEKVRSANVSLWTRIFEFSRFDLGARRSKSTRVTFEISQLDTIYFKEEPLAEEIAARASDPRVHAVLKMGSRFHPGAVYMVTGLKIARGFKMTHTSTTDTGGHIGAGGTVVPEASVGGEFGMSGGVSRTDGFETTNDIVFAYQLLKIKPKGRGKNMSFGLEEFQDDAAFLNDEDNDDEEKLVDLDIDGISLVDLAETQKGLTVSLDEDQCAWLFPDE